VVTAVAVLLIAPATALAHPLGNFTINHYAALTIGRTSIGIDVVIDKAEIPAFEDRQAADTDLDGTVSDDEAATFAADACRDLLPDLHLARDGVDLAVVGVGQTISFPPGAGGLSTLRLECHESARLDPALDAPTTIGFRDDSFANRIGWHEIIARGDGTILDTHGLPATSPSRALTAYPADLIAHPLDIRTATIGVRPDPAATARPSAPGSSAPVGSATAGSATGAGPLAPSSDPAGDVPAAVPGGVAAELPDIFRTRDLTPLVILGSLAAAIALGAGHAVTPGHGKTLMAAWLVGTRGRPVHAVGLGLSVAVSHTLGILALAVLIVGAEGVFAPDAVVRATPVIASVGIVAMGALMLARELRRRFPRRAAAGPTGRSGWHDHGGGSHTHEPPEPSALSWRSLFVLGLAGGLVPSASALIILLGGPARRPGRTGGVRGGPPPRPGPHLVRHRDVAHPVAGRADGLPAGSTGPDGDRASARGADTETPLLRSRSRCET
jgi:nickel/cobalt exporter